MQMKRRGETFFAECMYQHNYHGMTQHGEVLVSYVIYGKWEGVYDGPDITLFIHTCMFSHM